MNEVNETNEITIRNLDCASVHRLRKLAWQDGKPLEEIARFLLIEAVLAREPKVADIVFDDPQTD